MSSDSSPCVAVMRVSAFLVSLAGCLGDFVVFCVAQTLDESALEAMAEDLLATIRDVIVVHVCGGDSRATDLSDMEIEAMRSVSEGASLAALQRIMQLFLVATDEIACQEVRAGG